MRLAYIFAVMMAGALPYCNALHAAPGAKALNKIKTFPDFAAPSPKDGNRLLRRVDNGEFEIEEERGFSLKDTLKKLNPIKAAVKAKDKAKEVTEKITDADWKKLVEHLKIKGDKRS
ncbi:avr2 secreted RxLR effector peptide protein, putative [Phytophthora infestans T30-4]|uniref:RxLR effector protein n=2 Tax=Phytophthora infestans TaxID=4787 RepID=D0NDJ8_PHYIT|nr:avr2 family secreted RxLR effector peptide protein, putative [Phytophthora infestans T30-4]XP_002902986.1 avr2 secreted RxLR effector peptide protein, putative [Phytophthora infestans T30-4]AYP64693.1 secreted RxLR effector Avr2 [Phytophthora infestans]AYP64694.1 secreted RxLR effector Avr2 [Phytophthora infestans]AYP64695.1 secreted RxLR effector Avr2 [Phytophthora infestans]AYP64696.1 secreted RxLR effector Avr2 [Phytophthora infestans]AYP64697.1 secreted RxLR effector Avr2 [Phytophthora|eukprot:XP_002902985.1 avr2 family secreted RxLR effector peptide protein, putative [Phytophthora infestans T30-4]